MNFQSSGPRGPEFVWPGPQGPENSAGGYTIYRVYRQTTAVSLYVCQINKQISTKSPIIMKLLINDIKV